MWYKIAQQRDLSYDIAQLLVAAERNTGQFNFNSFLAKITSQIVDEQVFDIALKKGIFAALKSLKINDLTPRMQEVVEMVRYNFKAEPGPQNKIDVKNTGISPKSEKDLASVEAPIENLLPEEEKNVTATGPKIL